MISQPSNNTMYYFIRSPKPVSLFGTSHDDLGTWKQSFNCISEQVDFQAQKLYAFLSH